MPIEIRCPRCGEIVSFVRDNLNPGYTSEEYECPHCEMPIWRLEWRDGEEAVMYWKNGDWVHHPDFQ